MEPTSASRNEEIRTTHVPDSDDEGPPPNVDTEYARLLKTRVTASGEIDSVTMKTLPLFEDKDIACDSLEPAVDCPDEVTADNTPPLMTVPAKKKRKRGNDSVRCILSTR